jgi:hypothetical protein
MPTDHPLGDLFSKLFIAQMEEESAGWRRWLEWMRNHPSIVSPLVMVCGRPWWIWYDELGDPIRFAWVEDRLNPLPKKKSASRSRRS